MPEHLTGIVIKSREELLLGRGLSEDDLKAVLDKFPFLPPVATIESSLLNLEKRGISREQVNAMVVKLPSILSCTAERTNALLDIFARYEIEFITKPWRLISSSKTIQERIGRMEELGLDITAFKATLFVSKENFERFIKKQRSDSYSYCSY